MTDVYYSDGSTPVRVGDEVELRGGLLLGFKRLKGRVIYVPGQSPPHPDMERDGLSWIAIHVVGSALIRRLVDPQSHILVHKTLLVRRSTGTPVPSLDLLDLETDN